MSEKKKKKKIVFVHENIEVWSIELKEITSIEVSEPGSVSQYASK